MAKPSIAGRVIRRASIRGGIPIARAASIWPGGTARIAPRSTSVA